MTPALIQSLRFLNRNSFVFFLFLFAQANIGYGQDLPCPASILVEKTDLTCPGANNGKITLTILNSIGDDITNNSALRFLWSPVQDTTASQLLNLEPGTYTVTVVNSDPDCVNDNPVESITIFEPSPVSFEFCQEISPNEVVGGQTGIAEVFFFDGQSPYTISWTGPVNGSIQQDNQSNVQVPGLPAGDYQFKVLDNCGTFDFCTLTITEPDCNDFIGDDSPEVLNPACFGYADGEIDFTPAITGGSISNPGAISFTWLFDNTQTLNPLRTNLTAQNYSVVIRDTILGCKDTMVVALTNPPIIQIQLIAIVPDTVKAGGDGQIKVNISGGTPPYKISWAGGLGSSSGTQTNVPAGNFTVSNLLHSPEYTVTVQDREDCEATLGDIRVDRIIVLPPRTEVAVKCNPDMTAEECCDYIKTIDPGYSCNSQPVRQCYCENSNDAIIFVTVGNSPITLNTTPQTSQTTVKSDTSGIGKILDSPAKPSRLVNNADCTFPIPDDPTRIKNRSIKIAVIDSGIKGNHQRLEGKVWLNGKELDNGNDDDGNCLTDDRYGYDYPNQEHVVVDEVGHGTHVAGIIASAFPINIDLQFINLKVYSNPNAPNTGKRPGDALDVACAIYYAVDKGAQIINLSLGYFNEEPSPLLYDALKLARDRGILVVVSSGNESVNIDPTTSNSAKPKKQRWPANFKYDTYSSTAGLLPGLNNIIVVGASDDTGKDLAKTYSNWGPNLVDILAPGNFLSTFIGKGNDEEKALEGTSMSAAYVTHVAAIAKAYNPRLTPPEFIDKLLHHGKTTLATLDTVVSCSCVINKDSLFAHLGLNTSITPTSEPGIVVPPKPSLTIPVTFPDGGFTKLIGDGKTFYRDVEIIVADGFGPASAGSPRAHVPNGIFYQKKYCATNRITWDGVGNTPTQRRGARNNNALHFVIVYIGDERVYGPQPIKKQ